MKKKSLKNLKQFRVKSKFWFYVQFRPRAQKLFFPICALILLAGILQYEYDRRGVWVFENAKAAVFEESDFIETAQSVSGESDRDGTMAQSASVADTLEVDHASPVQGSVIEVMKKVGQREGIDWKILTAVCIKESHCTADRVGDSGKSLGAFQIHTGYHPEITQKQAFNLEWSAEWTAKRLKRYAYLGESEMIRSHNGLVPNNANAYYVTDIYKIIESL